MKRVSMVPAILIAGVVLWAQVLRSSGAEDPAGAQAAAYVALVQADLARDEGSFREAILKYRDAADRYGRIAQEYPDWQRDVVQYRLAYCANRIKGIERESGRPESEWIAAKPAESAGGGEVEILRSQYRALLQENEYLRRRLLEIQEEIDVPEAPATDGELERLRQENARLTEALRNAQQSPPPPPAPVPDSGRIAALESEIKKLQAGLEAAGRESVALQERLQKAQETASKIPEIEKQLRESRRENEKAAAELKRQLSDAAVAQEKAVAALQAENRKIAKESSDWKKRAEKREANEAATRDQIDNFKRRIRTLNEERDALDAALRTTSNRLARLQAEYDAALEQARAAGEETAATKTALDETRKRVDELNTQIDGARKESAKGAIALQKAIEEARGVAAARDELAAQVQSLVSTNNALAGDVAALQEGLGKARADESRIAGQLDDARSAIREIEAVAVATQEQLADLLAQRDEAVQRAEAAEAALEDARSSLAAALAERETERVELEALRARPVAPAGDNEPSAQEKKGREFERKGLYSDALGIYDEVLAAQPLRAESLKARGRCLLHLGRPSEAMASMRAGVQAHPEDIEMNMLLGMSYCHQEKFLDAVTVLQPVVENAPSNVTARNTLGAAYLGLGRIRQARVELERTVELDPSLSDAHYNLAQACYFDQPRDAQRARAHYRRALELGSAPDPHFEKLLDAP